MRKNKKGFTLAELLIVVAIIAVLVAIAIPIFNSQLEKAREATDIANVRDYYAEISVGLLDGSLHSTNPAMTLTGGKTATASYDSTGALQNVKITDYTVNQKIYGSWSIDNPTVAGVAVTAPASGATVITYTFTVATDGIKNTYLSGISFGTT